VQELFLEICFSNLGLAKFDMEAVTLYIMTYGSSFVISTFIYQFGWKWLLKFSTEWRSGITSILIIGTVKTVINLRPWVIISRNFCIFLPISIKLATDDQCEKSLHRSDFHWNRCC